MIVFLVFAALMLVVALFIVLPTLLRKESGRTADTRREMLNLEVLRDQLRELDADRAADVIDQAGYDSAVEELKRRVADDVRPGIQTVAASGKPWLAILLGALLPALAVTLYLLLGNPAGLDPRQVAGTDVARTVTAEQINGLAEKLVHHLKDQPDDIKGWNMLVRCYRVLGRFKEAGDAYAHLIKLTPPDAGLLADYADVLVASANGNFDGEPEKIIAHALELDPGNVKALALSGAALFSRQDFSAAIAQWKKIIPLVPPDSEMAQAVAVNIEAAQTRAGMPNTSPVAASPDASGPSSGVASSAAGAQVSGVVELDPALRSQAADTDLVFIFARAVNGPRFPLAVLRKHVKDLPAAFVLDDSMSMMPNAKLSGFPMVVVGARISKTGNATPSAGDLEGLTEPVRIGAKNVTIRINSRTK